VPDPADPAWVLVVGLADPVDPVWALVVDPADLAAVPVWAGLADRETVDLEGLETVALAGETVEAHGMVVGEIGTGMADGTTTILAGTMAGTTATTQDGGRWPVHSPLATGSQTE
jgi:hypothetical protein